jgi:hypothetical protein
MKIETKYDIGQEVWVPIANRDDKKQLTGDRTCYRGVISDVCDNRTGVNVDDLGLYIFAPLWHEQCRIYPTKEACEQAIKEMESND